MVAVSGGADSVALLNALLEIDLCAGLFAAHFEHGIRGQDSLDDADFVSGLCEKLGVALFTGHGDVLSLARTLGQSVETAARNARYAFLLETAKSCGANAIALAHHKDDQAETSIMNLIRGSGARGLAGMPPSRTDPDTNIRFIRPFLDITRVEIENYLSEKNVKFREDATNADTDYKRNSIRHNLMPILRGYNPNVVSALSQAAQSFAKDDDALTGQAQAYILAQGSSLYEETPYGARINIESLKCLHPAVAARAVREFAKRLDIADLSFRQTETIASGQETNLPGGWSCERFRSILSLVSPKPKIPKCTLTFQRVTAILPSRMIDLSKDDLFRCFLDIDKLNLLSKTGRIFFRTRKPGDRISPLGADGTQKLKQYLIDKGIERPMRDILPLLAHEPGDGSHANILWVPGGGISRLAAINIEGAELPLTNILHLKVTI